MSGHIYLIVYCQLPVHYHYRVAQNKLDYSTFQPSLQKFA